MEDALVKLTGRLLGVFLRQVGGKYSHFTPWLPWISPTLEHPTHRGLALYLQAATCHCLVHKAEQVQKRLILKSAFSVLAGADCNKGLLYA